MPAAVLPIPAAAAEKEESKQQHVFLVVPCVLPAPCRGRRMLRHLTRPSVADDVRRIGCKLVRCVTQRDQYVDDQRRKAFTLTVLETCVRACTRGRGWVGGSGVSERLRQLTIESSWHACMHIMQ